MKIQTAALRFFTTIDCDFLNAPFVFEDEQDVSIQQFYPGLPCYDWCPDQGREGNDLEFCPVSPDVSTSVQLILERIKTGSYDGLISFSQGAAICARALRLLESEANMYNIKVAVFIAGVNPKDWPGPENAEVVQFSSSKFAYIHELKRYLFSHSRIPYLFVHQACIFTVRRIV